MPFPALLRTTLLLTSLTATAAYTLYETNPTFRSFVDSTLDQLSTLWTDVLSALSPEDAARQREHQRHVFLGELGSRGVQGARDAAAAVVPNGARDGAMGTGMGSGSGVDVDVGGGGNDARMRRRALWEVAEENAAQIRRRAAASDARAAKSDDISRSDGGQTRYPAGATVLSAEEGAGNVDDATALHSHPMPRFLGPEIGGSADADADADEAAVAMADAGDMDLDMEFDDAASQSTTSTEKFSRVMTPTSPSLYSASEADMTESELRDVDPMEDLRSDGAFDRIAAGDPPVADLDVVQVGGADGDDDPAMSDIGSLGDGHGDGLLTPSTMSLSDADEVMSLVDGSESAFSDAGWATADSGDEEWDAAGVLQELRHRL